MKLQKILIAFALLSVFGCTDLEETLREDLSAEAANELLLESADVSALLKAVYDGLQLPSQDQARVFAAHQHTSDETIGPTRGPDWDDNGVWRSLHDHTWDADHQFLGDTFNDLLRLVFDATNVLSFQPNAQQAQKWDPASRDVFLNRMIALTADGAAPGLVVWPEASVP